MPQALKTDATIWSVTPNGSGGYTFGAPAAIKCRWEDGEVLYYALGGEQAVGKATIIVERDVAIDSYIFQGTSNAADPRTIGALRVMQFFKTPDLRNLRYFRKVIAA